MEIETVYSKDIEFEASSSLESQRIPDFYKYLIQKGELYSRVTKKPVKESITRRTVIEEIEYHAFEKIKNWAVYSIHGSCIWISPPARSDLSAKAIVSEIQYDPELGKTLVNRNICFEWDPKLFLHFAHSNGYQEIATGEDLRGIPMFFLTENAEKIYEFLENVEPIQIEMVRSGEDVIIKEELKQSLAKGEQAPIGSYAPSCDGAFNIFGDFKEIFCKNCPNCGKWIGKPISIGYKCECGAVKRC